eukprot:2533777-Amphidinium_carterae.1
MKGELSVLYCERAICEKPLVVSPCALIQVHMQAGPSQCMCNLMKTRLKLLSGVTEYDEIIHVDQVRGKDPES